MKHQWVANATYYNHAQDDYGYRIIPGFGDPVLRIFMIPIQIGGLNRNLHRRFYFIRHSPPLASV